MAGRWWFPFRIIFFIFFSIKYLEKGKKNLRLETHLTRLQPAVAVVKLVMVVVCYHRRCPVRWILPVAPAHYMGCINKSLYDMRCPITLQDI